LLGNCSVNTFPRQRIRRQQSNNFSCYATVPQTRLRNNSGSGIFCGSASRLYNEDLTQLELDARVEVGSNTSIVVLRVVGGAEKGTECLGV
jgi:hypothetical protein